MQGYRNQSLRPLQLLAVTFGLLSLCGQVWARPGGGELFSGGGGGGGGGGDGDDLFGLLFFFVELFIEAPAVAFVLLLILGGAAAAVFLFAQRSRDSAYLRPPMVIEPPLSAPKITVLDPDFSWVRFEDFAFRLFSTAHGARGNQQAMDALAPYVSAAAREHLVQRAPAGAPVTAVIVGAQRRRGLHVPASAVDAYGNPQSVHIHLEFEANYTGGPPGEQRRYYTVERWRFSRRADARTKPLRSGVARMFPCPNCGAAWESNAAAGGQKCAYCGEIVDNGRFDWQVTAVKLVRADDHGPKLLDEVPERGTELSTRMQPDFASRWEDLTRGDPAMTRAALLNRIRLIYDELNRAWAANELSPVRGFVSDGLYDYLGYWVAAYDAQGLRNSLDDMQLTNTELCKVVRDRSYDAVVVRIYGQGKDYVVNLKSGTLVRGSKTHVRKYSEYWTFIRAAGRSGAITIEKSCPSCGAPLAVSMAGACEHCNAHVTAGEFDWVLSKIEQDDSYSG